MEALEKRILTEGEIRPGGILKVDGFLNHRIDPQLSYDMAVELKRLYEGTEINKVLTIEASGIAMACMAAYVLGCPLVFAKKSKTKNISDDVWSVEIESFTHGNTNTVVVSKQYLGPEDKVLIIDDFLATGAALRGLKALVEQAGGTVVGAGIAIEKAFQGGGDEMRREGISGRRRRDAPGRHASGIPREDCKHDRRQHRIRAGLKKPCHKRPKTMETS